MIKRESVEAINKKTLYRDEIRDQIRQAIISHELKPGDRIVETRWAKDLGVSQSPVREAIRELEIMGYVTNVPYKGSVVREITKEEMLASYKIRTELDKIAAEEACERITPEERHILKTELDNLKAAAKADDFEQYVKNNTNFHRIIVRAAHNSLLIRLWEQCNIESWIYHGTENTEKDLNVLAARHEALYEAIVSGDVGRALHETEQHTGELSDEIALRDSIL